MTLKCGSHPPVSLKQFGATVIISILIKKSLAENQDTKTQ